MILEKGKNTRKGIFFGFINKIVTLLLPFIVQTITIKTLGMDYVGVKGLFSSILTVLSLTELGVGSAIVFSMYKPIAEDDIETIGAYMNLYRKLYRLIGGVVALLGIAIAPFVKYLINGDYPRDINLSIVFILYLANTVVSYWMYAYKSSLLNAYQRTDVISVIGTVTNALTSIFQIVFLLLTHNFYLYLIVSIAFTVANNLIISFCVDKMYPEIDCKGHVQLESLKRMRGSVAGVFIGKICGISRNSFDSIFVSVFLGLTQAAMYSNYFYILFVLNGFMGIVLSSLVAGVGNSIAIETKEKNFEQMMKIDTVYMAVSGWAAICMLCLYQPFMALWVGKDFVFPEYVMILFPIYFYVGKMGDIRGVYSDAAGLFWENKNRTLIELFANVVLNYVFVVKWGTFGIVLATILTLLFIGFVGSTIVIFKYYYETGMREYIREHAYWLLITIIAAVCTYCVCTLFESESQLELFFIRLGICCFLSIFLILLMSWWRKSFREAVRWVVSIMVRL